MSTPAFRAATSVANGPISNFSLAVPAGYAAGDLEIVFGQGNTGSAWTPTVDATEWTMLFDVGYAQAWVRRRTASSASTVQFALSQSGSVSLGLLSYTGGSTYQIATSSTLTAPSMSVGAASVAARLFFALSTTFAAFSSDTTANNRVRKAYSDSGVELLLDAGDDTFAASAGSTGSASATVNTGHSATSPLAVTVLISDNRPPNTAAWSSPADAAILDRSVDQVLTPEPFSDPDPGDSQSKISWRVSSDGGSTWTTTTTTTITPTITIPGGTLAAGSYQFQLKFADQSGTWAASWSPSLHLTFADAPSAPTIITPASGGTVTATNTLSWSFSGQVQYEARKVADAAGAADPSTIYWDTGNVPDANTRDLTITNSVNGRWEHQQVRCMNSTGLWSPWADSRVDVTFDPPPTPTFTLTPVVDPFADPPKAAITVTVATAAPGTGEVAATSVTVEARPVGATADEWSRSGQPINGDVDFETPASGVEYEFRVTAYADNGATADTGWLTASSS